MKANKKNPGKEIELRGRVTDHIFGKGSKSQHQALYLETETGTYKLKRKGGNPFFDETLRQYLGATVVAKGIVQGYVFLISSIEVDE